MFDFEWDPAKAASNLRKHSASLELAATAFRDPLMRSIPDEDHSEFEDRWVSMGRAEDGRPLVVSHTETRTEGTMVSLRLISARPATRRERRHCETGE